MGGNIDFFSPGNTVVKLSCEDVFGPGDFVLPVLVINFKSVNKPYFKNFGIKRDT
jgi:hypothetical protein